MRHTNGGIDQTEQSPGRQDPGADGRACQQHGWTRAIEPERDISALIAENSPRYPPQRSAKPGTKHHKR